MPVVSGCSQPSSLPREAGWLQRGTPWAAVLWLVNTGPRRPIDQQNGRLLKASGAWGSCHTGPFQMSPAASNKRDRSALYAALNFRSSPPTCTTLSGARRSYHGAVALFSTELRAGRPGWLVSREEALASPSLIFLLMVLPYQSPVMEFKPRRSSLSAAVNAFSPLYLSIVDTQDPRWPWLTPPLFSPCSACLWSPGVRRIRPITDHTERLYSCMPETPACLEPFENHLYFFSSTSTLLFTCNWRRNYDSSVISLVVDVENRAWNLHLREWDTCC